LTNKVLPYTVVLATVVGGAEKPSLYCLLLTTRRSKTMRLQMNSAEELGLMLSPDEVSVLATALGGLLSTLNHEIEEIGDTAKEDQSNLMMMLSMKMDTEIMFLSLWTALGLGEEKLAMLLKTTQLGEGESE
jgi:hypothetical protein